ncbi:MAG: porin [Phycisphaerales bacterium]
MFCLGFKTTERVVLLVLAVTIGFRFPTFAAPQDTANEIPESARKTIADLTARVADLERVVGRLRSVQDEPWLTTRRAAEIRGLVQDVLADADTRSSLLQDGMAAGWDKGFFLGSTDGNFLLKVQGQLQARFVYNAQDKSADDDNRWGFENRRTKLIFSGNVIDPSWQYRIQTSASSDGGGFRLQSAFIAKEFGDNWTLRIGQFKPPFMREELVSSSRQLAVERSLVNEEFNQDRSQGVELAYSGDQFNVAVMLNEGFDRDNTPALAEDTEFAITTRAEALLAGSWDQFKDFTSWPNETTAVMIGAAVHYEQDEFGTGDGLFVDADADGLDDTPNNDELETLAFTADLSLEFGSANAFAAVVYRDLDSDVLNTEQLGIVVQGGLFLTDDWEIFARYEWGDLDIAGVDDLSIITFGVNRFWAKHALRWSMDVGIGLNELAEPWSASGAGWRTDASGEDDQIVVRSQMQLLF